MQYTELDVQELISVEEQTFDRSGLVPPLFETAKGTRAPRTCPQ